MPSDALDVGHLPSGPPAAPDFSTSAPAQYDPFGFDATVAANEFFLGPPQTVGPENTQTTRARQHDPEGSGPGPGSTTQEADFAVHYASDIAKDPAKIKDLQQKLVDSGFDITVTGAFDSKTVNALEEVIREAQRSGISIEEVFARLKQGKGKAEGRDLAKEGQNSYLSDLLTTYMRIWGKAPPPGYLERIAAAGWNVYEFGYYERSKPAYRTSAEYKMARFSANDSLARQWGFLR